ncbi:MAG: ATP-binding protein [Treponema sp.]|nr:ATP-binding protein [Treponema sp.]
MNRLLYKNLLKWKSLANRKPLVLYGARQVGKTWLLKEFGKREFEFTIYINFNTDRKVHSIFKDDISPQFIIKNLENYHNKKIEPAKTLLIFDEIHECQRAKDALKYFNEDAPQYYIAAAGSFLCISSGKFPVGQVNELTLYPMTFYEFLEAAGRGLLAETLSETDTPALINASHELFTMMLRQYLFVGGMPEAVKTFMETDSLAEVRSVQEVILNNYKNDFSKHINASDIPKVNMLFESIPFHLAKEKKKFIYKEVKTGGRVSEFENAMNWLINAGLVHKVDRTTDAKIPLSRYTEREYFKLYMLDVGLLVVKARLDISTFLTSDNLIFNEFKGALAEQFTLQELKALTKFPVFYWGNASGKAEVDFIVQYKNEIIPIEVKSSINTKSQSLSVYIEKYHPENAIRVSLKNYGRNGKFLSVPLYLIGNIESVLSGKY